MNCLVSISCITYNHEKYIARAIESFLMQKTNFDFEILIHDDASTDGTQAIIREYELKYPEKIKVIYQTENQYSKGGKVARLNIERAVGKYIALCEGDDYWTSPYKLQKQVDYMERNPECSLCVHAGQFVNDSGEHNIYHISTTDRKFTTEEVIKGGGGLFFTNSILYRAEYKESYPMFFKNSPVGDYPLVINLSLLGEVYYINEVMSAYQRNVKGSWTSITLSNPKNTALHYEKMIDMLEELNRYTNYKYCKVIKSTKKDNYIPIYLSKKEMIGVSKKELRSLFKQLSLKMKVILILNHYPNVKRALKYLKKSVKL